MEGLASALGTQGVHPGVPPTSTPSPPPPPPGNLAASGHGGQSRRPRYTVPPCGPLRCGLLSAARAAPAPGPGPGPPAAAPPPVPAAEAAALSEEEAVQLACALSRSSAEFERRALEEACRASADAARRRGAAAPGAPDPPELGTTFAYPPALGGPGRGSLDICPEIAKTPPPPAPRRARKPSGAVSLFDSSGDDLEAPGGCQPLSPDVCPEIAKTPPRRVRAASGVEAGFWSGAGDAAGDPAPACLSDGDEPAAAAARVGGLFDALREHAPGSCAPPPAPDDYNPFRGLCDSQYARAHRGTAAVAGPAWPPAPCPGPPPAPRDGGGGDRLMSRGGPLAARGREAGAQATPAGEDAGTQSGSAGVERGTQAGPAAAARATAAAATQSTLDRWVTPAAGVAAGAPDALPAPAAPAGLAPGLTGPEGDEGALEEAPPGAPAAPAAPAPGSESGSEDDDAVENVLMGAAAGGGRAGGAFPRSAQPTLAWARDLPEVGGGGGGGAGWGDGWGGGSDAGDDGWEDVAGEALSASHTTL